MGRITVGPMTAFIGIGLLGVGLMSMVLPYGILGGTMSHDNPWAPLTMTGVALPAYATPMVAMSQLGSMFQHGNSVGSSIYPALFWCWHEPRPACLDVVALRMEKTWHLVRDHATDRHRHLLRR